MAITKAPVAAPRRRTRSWDGYCHNCVGNWHAHAHAHARQANCKCQWDRRMENESLPSLGLMARGNLRFRCGCRVNESRRHIAGRGRSRLVLQRQASCRACAWPCSCVHAPPAVRPAVNLVRLVPTCCIAYTLFRIEICRSVSSLRGHLP